ncbi:hypothetical protein HZS_471, partial [Henneguya salminicola]
MSVEKEIVTPRLIPGVLHELNAGSIDWSYSGLIAYGCHNHIIICDYAVLEVVQTISIHKDIVTKISWKSPDCLASPKCRADSLTLISGDEGGSLFLTNVHTKKTIASVIKFGGAVKQIQWVSFPRETNSFALVLFSPDVLALFSDNNLYVCWRLKYFTSFSGFSLNSLNLSMMTINCHKSVYVYNDFSFKKGPNNILKKLNASENSLEFSISVEPAQEVVSSSSDIKNQKSLLTSASSVFKNIQGKLDKSPSIESGEIFSVPIIQCAFMPYQGNILYIITKRIIIVFNIDSEQTLTKLSTFHDIVYFIPSKFIDSFIIVHSNNFFLYVSEKKYSSNDLSLNSVGDCAVTNHYQHSDSQIYSKSTSYVYMKMAGIEPIRIGRQTVLSCFAVNPLTETEYVFLARTGQLLFYYLPFISQLRKCPSQPLPFETTLKEFIQQNGLFNSESCDKNLELNQKDFRCIQRAVLYNLNANPTCIKVSPPSATKSHRSYQLYSAIGFNDGTVQIFYLPYGVLRRTLGVFSGPVRQIEWLSLSTLISYTSITSSNKSEISLIDVKTGGIYPLKLAMRSQTEILNGIKVSESRYASFIALLISIILTTTYSLCILTPMFFFA